MDFTQYLLIGILLIAPFLFIYYFPKQFKRIHKVDDFFSEVNNLCYQYNLRNLELIQNEEKDAWNWCYNNIPNMNDLICGEEN
jgi:hypothetical protein